MKLLTIHSGPKRPGDYCFGIEGELAMPSVVCDNRSCGCDRAFGGLNSHRASTSLMVRDLEMSVDDVEQAYLAYLDSAGWAEAIRFSEGELGVRRHARETVRYVLDIASRYSVGTVVHLAYDRRRENWTFEAA